LLLSGAHGDSNESKGLRCHLGAEWLFGRFHI
jgi:hypothetical protein